MGPKSRTPLNVLTLKKINRTILTGHTDKWSVHWLKFGLFWKTRRTKHDWSSSGRLNRLFDVVWGIGRGMVDPRKSKILVEETDELIVASVHPTGGGSSDRSISSILMSDMRVCRHDGSYMKSFSYLFNGLSVMLYRRRRMTHLLSFFFVSFCLGCRLARDGTFVEFLIRAITLGKKKTYGRRFCKLSKWRNSLGNLSDLTWLAWHTEDKTVTTLETTMSSLRETWFLSDCSDLAFRLA